MQTEWTQFVVSDQGQHCTVELQWLEHLWNQENIFKTGVVRAYECLS